MKKFYESPIVEITVFDVEDVITASIGTSGETGETMQQYIDAVKADLNVAPESTTAAAEVYDFGAYNW